MSSASLRCKIFDYDTNKFSQQRYQQACVCHVYDVVDLCQRRERRHMAQNGESGEANGGCREMNRHRQQQTCVVLPNLTETGLGMKSPCEGEPFWYCVGFSMTLSSLTTAYRCSVIAVTVLWRRVCSNLA